MKNTGLGMALVLVFGVASNVSAGNVNTDSILVGNISGQPQSDGITISSSIYFISSSSLTLQGTGGYIMTSSSITASAFFGDGSHLEGVVIANATQTWSGANLFQATFTVQSSAGQIILSTSAVTENINISTTGIISFYPQLHNTAQTIIPQAQSTMAGLGPCVNGSTLTITTTGGRVELTLAASTGRGGDIAAAFGFLEDGQFVNDMSSSTAIGLEGLGNIMLTPFNYLVNAPPPGVHSFCITLAAFSCCGGSANLLNDSDVSNIFFIKEIK